MTEGRPYVRIYIVKPQDARAWIGFGCYVLVVLLLAMMWADKTLLKDDFFKVIATAIILTGWNQGPVGWAYQATKGGGEAADSNARIAEEATTRLATTPAGTPDDPLAVKGATSDSTPVHVQEKKGRPGV